MSGASSEENIREANDVMAKHSNLSSKENEQQSAQIAGRLDYTHPVLLCMRIILTFGIYICLRKKQFGGIQVTSRRVLYISGTKAAAGEIVEFQQVSYFIRHFAFEEHWYFQPTYDCLEKCMCLPLINWCLCNPLLPRTGIRLKFTRYPMGALGVGNSATGGAFGPCDPCVAMCMVALGPCISCFMSCCGCAEDGNGGYVLDTIHLEMNTNYKTGLMQVNNVIAAIMFYHPAKNTNFGKEWDPRDPYKHKRLLAIPVRGERDYNEWDEKHKVPVEKLEGNDVGTWGLVVGEKILDGYAPRLKFCNFIIWVMSILTCGIYYCVARCQYDHCADIERQYFLLTDRRLIKYVLNTKGAKTVPDLEENEGSKSEFRVTVNSYMLTAFHTFRWSEVRHPCACLGCAICCCKKRDYLINAHTSFGVIVIDDSGRDALEDFLKSMLNQRMEGSLRGVGQHMTVGKDQHKITPDKEEDVVLLKAPDGAPHLAENPLAVLEGQTWQGCCTAIRICCVRIGTCCCFPRDLTAKLFITDMRIITSAVLKVPCTGRVMDTYTEYYALSRVKRARVARRFKCQFCGCMNCCPDDMFSVSTDDQFEQSLNGEEAYTVKEIYGVDGEELSDKGKNLTAMLSLMNTLDGWAVESALRTNTWAQMVPGEMMLASPDHFQIPPV